ncbi:MAG: hypothetical protein K2X82_21310 [Gemmataceae bacterium]|nr:hypothetical protein [Gemmataceae bacterium]
MGRRGAVILALGLAVAPAAGQDSPHYWPNREVGIPVGLDRLDPKPTHVQLYTSTTRPAAWKAGPKLAAGELQPLAGGRSGFLYKADRDGPHEFAAQLFYADGSASPADPAALTPMQAVVIDTTPPAVRIRAVGNGVEWAATDDNLDPAFAELQAKYPHWADWQAENGRQFRAADRFAWQLRRDDTLEVRVRVRDRAGNDQWSRIVRVPGDGAAGAAVPRGGNSEWLTTGGGGGGFAGRDPLVAEPGPPRPRMEYVNTKNVTVDYAIQKMGPSGVRSVRLFVLPDREADWKLVKDFDVNLKPGDTGPPQPLPYEAPHDGVYGFYVAPESPSGQKAAAPRRTDPPMLYVVVDTQNPYVKITNVRVTPGPNRLPRVEIAWEAEDANLLPNPVNLEYSLDRAASEWKPIKYGLDNNAGKSAGRYTWEVPDEKLWKFYVRARVSDKAERSATHIWSDKGPSGEPTEVIVDLEVPAATINSARRDGGAGSDKPPVKLP